MKKKSKKSARKKSAAKTAKKKLTNPKSNVALKGTVAKAKRRAELRHVPWNSVEVEALNPLLGRHFVVESNIMQLENILRDPRYAGTTFVMIHGGYPLEREAIWLAAIKNVYMDSSLMEIAMYPSSFKDSLRQWLETFPDKITFGTDCFPYNEILGAEESYWLGNISARQALAAALAEMVSSGEI
ncbi:MAG: hypothetical protein DMG80_07370, partial [Acidobacteria bacterium]